MPTQIPGIGFILPDGLLGSAALKDEANIAPTQLAQRAFMRYPLPLTLCRIWDAMASILTGTPATDDLGLITGTPGTNSLKLSAGDCKAAVVSRKCAFELEVPANYDANETLQVRIRAGMETTISDTSATVDLEVYRPDGDGLVSADLCTTAAQSINSLTKANKDFSIDVATISAGDRLICVVTIACTDVATATAVTPVITDISRLADTRG